MKKKQNPVFWGIVIGGITLIIMIILLVNDVVDLVQTIFIPLITGIIPSIIGLVPSIREHEEKEEQKKTFSKFLKTHSINDRTSSNPFDYRNDAINLYGREEECTRIWHFLDTEEQRKVWAVTGHGGMGKSKLAFHIAKKYKLAKWHVFWLTETTIGELAKCEIDTDGDHLFICDYAGRYTESIAELLKKLHDKGVCFRMLLLERASYGNSSTDTESWFAKLRRSEAVRELFSSFDLEYCEDPLSPAPLNLTKHLLDKAAYGMILDDFAKAKGGKFTSKQKKEIIAFVCNGMKNGTNERSGEDNRCLFLLFTADAVLNDGKLEILDKAGVFQSYINKKMECHFPTELKEHEKTALLLLAMATAGGAFDLCDTQTGECEKWCAELREILSGKRSKTAKVLSVLCERSDADTTAVTPLLPDLLGEFLVMYIYKEYKPKEMFPLLFSNECRSHFEDFLTRLISDWGEDARAETFIEDAEQWAENNGKSPDKLLLAHVYHDVGLMHDDRADYHRALSFYQKALAIKEVECGKDSPDTAATYNNIGAVYDNLANYDEALKYYQKALDIYEQNEAYKNHPSTANTYNNIGVAYQNRGRKGDLDEALTYYQKALDIYEQNEAYKNHPSTAKPYNNIGVAYQNRGRKGDLDEALTYYQKALDIYEQNETYKNHPSTADTYNNIGAVYDNLANYDEALKYYQKALDIYEQNEAYKNHPSTADTYNNIGVAYQNRGRKGDLDEALTYYQKALDIYEQNEAYKNHPSTADTYNNIGVAYRKLGDYDEALKYYQKALDIYEQNEAYKNHPSTADTYNNIGVAYQNRGRKGDLDEALTYYQKALDIYEQNEAYKNHPSTANTYNNLGVLHENQTNYSQALEYYTKAHMIFQNTYGDDHPHTKIALRNICDIEALLNEE